MYNWITLLYNRKEHNIVYHQYFNKINFFKKREERSLSEERPQWQWRSAFRSQRAIRSPTAQRRQNKEALKSTRGLLSFLSFISFLPSFSAQLRDLCSLCTSLCCVLLHSSQGTCGRMEVKMNPQSWQDKINSCISWAPQEVKFALTVFIPQFSTLSPVQRYPFLTSNIPKFLRIPWLFSGEDSIISLPRVRVQLLVKELTSWKLWGVTIKISKILFSKLVLKKRW